MPRIITVTSGKGGVGKTSVSVNLAVHLAQSGCKCCLFDADLGLANVNILLGIYPAFTLEHVIDGQKSLKDVIVNDSRGFDIIPGSSGVEKLADLPVSGANSLIKAFSELQAYDYLIIDTSSGISEIVVSFCLASTDIILVIVPEPASLVDGYALLKVLSLNGYRGRPVVLVNNSPSKPVARSAYHRLKAAVRKHLPFDLTPLGVVYHDPLVGESVKKQTPVIALYPESAAARCLKAAGSRLLASAPADMDDESLVEFWTRYFDIAGTELNFGGIVKDTAGYDLEKSIRKPAEALPEKPGPEPPAAEKGSILDRFTSFSLSRLPVKRSICEKLAEACGQPQASPALLADIIALDPVLVVKVLKLAGTGRYAERGGNSLVDAVKFLGLDTISNMATTQKVLQTHSLAQAAEGFDSEGFLHHALACAVLSRAIAQKTHPALSGKAYLSGLVHDIGQLAFWSHYPDEYSALHRIGRSGPEDILRAETELGATHCQVGARLLEQWGLDSYLADAALYHHEPLERVQDAFPLVKIVYAANSLTTGINGNPGHLPALSRLVHLEPDVLAELKAETDRIVRRISEEPDDDGGKTDTAASLAETIPAAHRINALLQGTVRSLLHAPDRKSIVKSIRDALAIICDINQVLCFISEPGKEVMRAYRFASGLWPDMADDLDIPLDGSANILVRCLKKGRLLVETIETDQRKTPLIDITIAGLLGAGTIMTIPLMVRLRPLGVVVIGGDDETMRRLQDESGLLASLSDFTALSLDAERLRHLKDADGR